MSIFDEVSGRYRAPRLEDLPPPPEPSIWRKAQQGLSDFMDSPWGAAAEIPLTVVTSPQRAVESAIGAFRGGFELSEAERKAYGEEAFDRDAAVPKFGGGESGFETLARRLRGRAYTAPAGGQIARETVAGAGELLGAPSTATVMGLSRDGTQAGGYRPIAESEQKAFEAESPVLSRVAAPLRVGVDFAGSLATDPTSLLAFGPKLAGKALGSVAKEAADSAIRTAALETAKAERLASRLFVPGAAVGAVGGTLEAGRAISEDGLFSPEAIEASLGAGLATGMGALATKNSFRGLESLPKPPDPVLKWYGLDPDGPAPAPTARPAETVSPEPIITPPPQAAPTMRPPTASVPFMVTRKMEADLAGMGYDAADIGRMTPAEAWRVLQSREAPPNQPTNLADLPPPPEPLREFDVPSEPDRYAYRARTVGEQGIPATGHAQASTSERDVRRMAPSRTEEAQEVVRADLKGLDPSKYELLPHPDGGTWVRLKEDLPEAALERVGPIDAIDRAAADKATPPVRAAVESADVADLAQATGLTMERAAKGADDVRADGVRELSPEAVAIKKTVLQSDPAMLETPAEAPPVDLRSDPTEPPPSAPPARAAPPERRAKVQRGHNGAVDIEFADPRDKELFSAPGRSRRAMRGESGRPANFEGLGKQYGTDYATASRVAREYRDRIMAAVKDLPEGDVFRAPRPDFGATRPILGGPALNDVRGYQGTPSHKAGTALEGIPEGPKEIAAAIERDKGNALELRVRDAILRNDTELGEHFDRTRAATDDGDASFDFGENAPTVDLRADPTEPPVRNADVSAENGQPTIPDAPRKPEPPEFTERVLSMAGNGKPGFSSVETTVRAGAVEAPGRLVVYRDPSGRPVATATVVETAQGPRVKDMAARPGNDLLRGRAVAAVGQELKRLGATEAAGTMSPDAANLRSRAGIDDGRKLSAEPVRPPQADAGPAVGVDHVRKAFPTGKITESEGAWDVRLPGNRNIRVTPTGDVEFSLGDLRKGHPDAVQGGALAPGQRVVGSWQRIGRGGLISLAKEAGQGTLDHETFHAAMELVLSDRERKAVLKRFGNEEKAADAYGAWTPAEKSNAVFAKLAAFFKRLYRSLFPDAESVFGKVRTGEAFERKGAPFAEVPLPARVATDPTATPAAEARAPTNYREFLDSSADEVPSPAAAKPAPEFPPVTGRRVLPGETPRVEHRVDDLAAATADAGVPELPLDRDTVQSWESLDPKVKKILRTYDEQTFYDAMKTRNLDAAETQAFDAVIKGKSERLEKLKAQERTPDTDREIAAQTLDYIAAQRAYVNDGTGLARALAARARVMSAARPAEAFARRLETLKVTPQIAGEVLSAIRKDSTLLDLIRAEARQRRLSVVEGTEGAVRLSAKAVANLSDRLRALGLSDEQSNAFVKALRDDADFLPELEAAVKNEAAEPTDVLLKKVFREIKGVSDEQAAEILAAFKENPDNLAPLLQSAFGSNKIRKALEWWRAGMLSAFSTDAANVSGNVAEHHIRLAETGVAGALDWMLQKVYGGDRARFVGEVGAEMAGANMAFGPALKNLARNMMDVVKLKDKPLDLSRKLEGQFGAIGGTTGKVVRAIGYGRMGAEDVFFKEWGGGAEAMKLAYRKAANSLPAGTSKSEIKARAKQIIDEMADPENAAHSDIMADVETAKLNRTFQERRVGSLTDAISGVVRRNPMLAFVAPFVNTPGNIANAIIKRSPLGAKRAIRAFGEFKKAQTEHAAGRIDDAAFSAARGKLADAIASPLMGTALLAGFTLYANAGGMTGSGPTDDRAKNALKESGWSPYSFVFTDPTTGKKAYVPFNRFEPISSLLGFAADMAEAKNVRNLSLFDKALGSAVENLTSKSYLTGLSEAASLITKPKEFAPQYIKGFVGSWVPNIIGKTAAAVDPILRDTRASKGGFAGLPEAVGKNIQSRIPFASKMLPARVSSTGQPIERPGNALTRFASPTQPTIEKPERFLEREYGRLGWAPTAPSRNVTVKGIQTNLEDREFDVMTKAQRRASDEARNLVRSPHYKSLPDDQRELLLDRIYSKWKARGRQSIRANLERRVAREARA